MIAEISTSVPTRSTFVTLYKKARNPRPDLIGRCRGKKPTLYHRNPIFKRARAFFYRGGQAAARLARRLLHTVCALGYFEIL